MIVHYHSSGLFSQSRCSLENWDQFSYDHTNDRNPKTNKNGIRCYSFFASLFLRLFGKVHIEKTKDGKSVYLNRKSFKKWIKWRGFTDNASTQSKSTPQSTAVKTETVRQGTVRTLSEGNHPLGLAATGFKETVSQECSEDLGKIWGLLLARIPTKEIVAFEQTEDNHYTLQLSRPITLWLNSRSRDGTRSSPKGGTVVLLGHNKSHTLEIKTCPGENRIEYKRGMQFWCDTGQTGVGVKELDVVFMQDLDADTISLKAGCKVFFVFQSREKKQTKESFYQVWSQATLLDPAESYKRYLERKALLN